jgi:hypothetical protein
MCDANEVAHSCVLAWTKKLYFFVQRRTSPPPFQRRGATLRYFKILFNFSEFKSPPPIGGDLRVLPTIIRCFLRNSNIMCMAFFHTCIGYFYKLSVCLQSLYIRGSAITHTSFQPTSKLMHHFF